ncbi:sedoheptulose 7-phosphate cyclase [Streptomyces sp. NBC_01275]|uniref:sedoheptulose 7-phosphate cyclase n=1 Tax=Streptomyces sp. NBC_01275 TaxID=2903807 RepID=UPI00225B832E|nr:sedoheptulose 7-phosphate cyclase [Streptomyces sp. NBC_01275]MCX4766568.1 sedoheptulose 7-phosphate cyclase [Streptomyces sp. NBC_01275]
MPFPPPTVHGLTTTEGPGPARSWTVSTAKPVRYRVRFAPGVLDPRTRALARAGAPADGPAPARRLLVVEERVDLLYGDAIRASCEAGGHGEYAIHVLPAHERLKTMESVYSVVGAMDRFGLDRRREPVVAVGGGVLLDVVGLACSLYRRSTPYVRVPTTLIGLVDAGVGAKTGVNFGAGKNRLGTYHPAVETLLDPGFLATLDRRHIGNGLAEILKIALIKDRDLFDLLAGSGRRLLDARFQADEPLRTTAHHVLARAVHGMLEELHDNLWEHRLERVVDYGHSFSPTLEMRALPALLHGEAVNLDMALTTVIARNRALMTDRQSERVLAAMRALRLPVHHPLMEPELLRDALADTVRHRDGMQRLPLPVGIGDAVFVNDLTDREIALAAEELARAEEVRSDA